MTISRVLRQQRLILVGGTVTPIAPPAPFTMCMVGNGTLADLRLYTSDDLSQNEYRAIAAGYERQLQPATPFAFRTDEVAFWLLSGVGGLVMLQWS